MVNRQSLHPASHSLCLRSVAAILSVSILSVLAACSPHKDNNNPTPGPGPASAGAGGNSSPTTTESEISLQRVERVPVASFIADREVDPKTGQITDRPLSGYMLTLDHLMDKDQSFSPRPGRLAAETVVFGLPRGSGDTGRHYEIAIGRAAELFVNTPDEQRVMDEVAEPGTIALVRIETLGYPADRKAGQKIPVWLVPIGNASALAGGHIYNTVLRCDRTREVMATHPYGHFLPEQLEEYDRRTFRRWAARQPGSAEEDYQGPREKRFLLKDGFEMVRQTSIRDQGRDEIRITVGGFRYDQDGRLIGDASVDDEIVDSIVTSLNAEKRVNLHAERIDTERRQILIIPRERSLAMDDFYDVVRTIPVRVMPKRQLHIIADNNNGRIIIAGPEMDRKLSGRLTFDSASSDTPGAFVASGFRVLADPEDQRQHLKVQWSQLPPGGQARREGEGRIKNDLGELLRYLYLNGMSPDDCFLVCERARNSRVIDAQLSLFPKRINPRIEEDDDGTKEAEEGR